MKNILLLAGLVALFSSCSSLPVNSSKISLGMTEGQVRESAGDPMYAIKLADGNRGLIYTLNKPKQHMVVLNKDGRVIFSGPRQDYK